jgi:hypothetical protein
MLCGCATRRGSALTETRTLPAHESCNHLLYKLSCADYEALLARCGNRCEICGVRGEDAPRRKLFIDHDHRYGLYAIRGLLCARCNILMRDVDRCRRTDDRATGYLANAWFMWRLVNPPGSEKRTDPRVRGGWERPIRVPGEKAAVL